MAASRVYLTNAYSVLNEEADILKKEEKTRKRNEKKVEVHKKEYVSPSVQERGRWADLSEDEDDNFLAEYSMDAFYSEHTENSKGNSENDENSEVSDKGSEKSDDDSESSEENDASDELDKQQITMKKQQKAKATEQQKQLSRRDKEELRLKELEELDGMLIELGVSVNKSSTPKADGDKDGKKKKKKKLNVQATAVPESSSSEDEQSLNPEETAKRLAKLRIHGSSSKRGNTKEEIQRLAASEAKKAKENMKKEKKSKLYFPKTN